MSILEARGSQDLNGLQVTSPELIRTKVISHYINRPIFQQGYRGPFAIPQGSIG